MQGYEYDEFGNQTISGNSTFLNEVTFTGAIADSTGLYYMNARFYNPNTGRFLTQDTYTGNAYEPWSQHLYSYTGNNPINYIDPTGHIRLEDRLAMEEDWIAPPTYVPEPDYKQEIDSNDDSNSSLSNSGESTLEVINDYFNENFDNYIDGSAAIWMPEIPPSKITYTKFQADTINGGMDILKAYAGSKVFGGLLKKVLANTKLLRVGKFANQELVTYQNITNMEHTAIAVLGCINRYTNIFGTDIEAGTITSYYVTTDFTESSFFISENQIFRVDIHENGDINVILYTPW